MGRRKSRNAPCSSNYNDSRQALVGCETKYSHLNTMNVYTYASDTAFPLLDRYDELKVAIWGGENMKALDERGDFDPDFLDIVPDPNRKKKL